VTKWTPAIHMPRWASRITLEITGIRVERLQAITEADAKAEGARLFPDIPVPTEGRPPWAIDHAPRWSMFEPPSTDHCLWTAHSAFGNAWIQINGQPSWDSNPWVWALSFRRVRS
jgi:hypothetical protein